MIAGETITIAPREVQQTHKLLNTGWALATIDNQRSGLVPINHLLRKNSAQPPQLPTENDEILINKVANMPSLNVTSMGVGEEEPVSLDIHQNTSRTLNIETCSDKKLSDENAILLDE